MTRAGWGRAIREILRRAEAEPLAGIIGWTMTGFGWALWMALQAPLPAPLDGVIAFEAWAVTALGGPLVVLSEGLKKRRSQGAER